MRFLFVIFGLLVIIFAWAGGALPWAAILLTIIGIIQIIVAFSQKPVPTTTPPPPPPPPPEPKPAPPKPEPAEGTPEEEKPAGG